MSSISIFLSCCLYYHFFSAPRSEAPPPVRDLLRNYLPTRILFFPLDTWYPITPKVLLRSASLSQRNKRGRILEYVSTIEIAKSCRFSLSSSFAVSTSNKASDAIQAHRKQSPSRSAFQKPLETSQTFQFSNYDFPIPRPHNATTEPRLLPKPILKHLHQLKTLPTILGYAFTTSPRPHLET